MVPAVFCDMFFVHLWKDGNIGDHGWPMAKSSSRNSLHCDVLNASPTEQRLFIYLFIVTSYTDTQKMFVGHLVSSK